MKYFGANLIKYMLFLYTKNYKSLLREIKNDLNKRERHTIFMNQKIQ